MKSRIIKIFASLTILLVLGLQQAVSQNKNVVKNNVEFNEKLEENNLNSIQNVKEKKLLRKVTKKTKIVTMKDLQRIVDRKKGLRYRNKRNHKDKCYSSSNDCNTNK